MQYWIRLLRSKSCKFIWLRAFPEEELMVIKNALVKKGEETTPPICTVYPKMLLMGMNLSNDFFIEVDHSNNVSKSVCSVFL